MKMSQSIIPFCCLLFLAGCGSGGPELAPVTGVLTSEGKPMPSAMIEFFPEEGVTSTGITDAEGKYSLKYNDEEGAIIGTHTVQVTVGLPQTSIDPDSTEMAPPVMEPPKTVVLAEKVTVEAGENSIDLKFPPSK
jgi:hypothetical protein